jgi:hypothetical protein
MNVRIQYTIPGWEPAAPSPRPGPAETGRGFDLRLHETAAIDVPGFRELLDLNRAQPGDPVLAPPPRPASASYTDAAEDRRAWHSLLGRHFDTAPASSAEERMLTLLVHLQDLEDAVAARTLVGAKA